MIASLLILLSTARAENPDENDFSLDLGSSSGCFGICLSYDRQVGEKLDIGVTVTPLLLFNGLAVYTQYELGRTDSRSFYLEPNGGVIWSPASREIFYGGTLALGMERDLEGGRYRHVHIGGGAMDDGDGFYFWPDARFGIGKRF